MTFKKLATAGCLNWGPVEEFKGGFGGRIRIADGWIGVREMECVCVCVCLLGYRGHLQRQGPPGAATLGHVFVVCVDWGRETSFYLLSLGELFDFLKIE